MKFIKITSLILFIILYRRDYKVQQHCRHVEKILAKKYTLWSSHSKLFIKHLCAIYLMSFMKKCKSNVTLRSDIKCFQEVVLFDNSETYFIFFGRTVI